MSLGLESLSFNRSAIRAEKNKKTVESLRRGKMDVITALSSLYLSVKSPDFVLESDLTKGDAKKEFAFLKKTYGWNQFQSIVMSIIANHFENELTIETISKDLDISPLMCLKYTEDLLSLEHQGFLFVIKKNNVPQCVIRTEEAIDAITHNRNIERMDRSNADLLDLLNDLHDFSEYAFNADLAQLRVSRFFLKYDKHPFLKKMVESIGAEMCQPFTKKFDSYVDLLCIVCIFISIKVFNDEDYISVNNHMDKISPNHFNRKTYIRELEKSVKSKDTSGFFIVNGKHIIENYMETEGFGDNDKYCLSAEGIEFFGLETYVHAQTRKKYDVKEYGSITEKKLFYDNDTTKQINTLRDLLENDNFVGIQKRLLSSNLRTGFNILLYGAAGTGKTETCLQLSRMTKRDLYIVEVNDFKDKFVGESEKRIKGIFKAYANMVEDYKKRKEPIPIMLLNEADAIIGIRKKGAENAVDKMENSVQNIILQEMENLKGIMVATTNLTENLDSAFERRFIYKIKYNMPDKDVKAKIWESNLPNLSKLSIVKLADEFDVSGGEIENIVRKSTVSNILYGDEISYEMIRDIAKNEKLCDKKHNKVGFSI